MERRKFEYNQGSLHGYWRVFQYKYTGDYAEDPYPILDTQGASPGDMGSLKLISS